MTNAAIAAYAKQYSALLEEDADLSQRKKDVLASAKEAGHDAKAIRKAAKELLMDSDKRTALYEHEHQLDLVRDLLGLTAPAYREAAE